MSSPYMQEALALATRGLGQVSPNPAVGAVLVRDGQVVGRGWHVYSDLKHAEILALEQAAEMAKGATLYVTLEPCSHYGRTPPCALAIAAAGVERVVAPIVDPNPRVAGSGFAILRQAGIEVEIDLDAALQASKLNEPFIHYMRTGRPLVLLKSALTLDGKIAAPEDNHGWITSELARAHVQIIRHNADAILTGIGTLLGDNPLLTDRSGLPRSRPLLRIVADSQLRTPVDSKMVASASEDLLIATTSAASADRRRALEQRGVEVVAFEDAGGRVDLRAVIEWLGARRYQSLMIEAGSKLNWAALEAGVVDKILFYYAPKILGGLQSLPVAGGTGRRRRVDAIELQNVTVHNITAEEFAVEAYIKR